MTAMRSAAARSMARELLARADADGDQPTTVAIAMQRACERISENLRRALGDDGFNALLVRVVTTVQEEHPALTDLCRVGDAGINLCNVEASVARHGASTVTGALEEALATLADVLGGLIGADMVRNILDLDDQPSPPSGNRQLQ